MMSTSTKSQKIKFVKKCIGLNSPILTGIIRSIVENCMIVEVGDEIVANILLTKRGEVVATAAEA